MIFCSIVITIRVLFNEISYPLPQEIEELMKQIYSAVAKAEITFSLPDLAEALKLIQSQYDEIAAKNLQVTHTCFQVYETVHFRN